MTKFKTITEAQLNDWEWDENHIFDVHLLSKHLIDWFNNIPQDSDEEFEFLKWDEDHALVQLSAPYWWCEVDMDEMDQAVVDKLHMKKEWVDQILCNG